TAAETEASLMAQLDKLQVERLQQLNRMMDNILQSCIMKVDEAMYELESPAHGGNQTATPEYVLTLLEKVQSTCTDFGTSFVRLVQGGDQADTIVTSNAFAHALAQLLHNAKGVTRLAADDDFAEEIVQTGKIGALNGRNFFEQMKSAKLGAVEAKGRPDFITTVMNKTHAGIGMIAPLVEKLVPKEVSLTETATLEDLGDVVEREMNAAAKAIEDAAKRLEELLSKPQELNVHGAILHAAKAITTAIANLIKCATASQQEIVAHGRGSSTRGAFYKKNNKWTEGLISAAKAVAVATTYLVECADGVVNGTHSMEQLVVAANEVSVATTQLVAASRVKAIPFSKTQDALEDAAIRVREATKLLVKAAKEAAKRSAENRINEELKLMNRHQFKVVEMEQQVKILEIEKELQNARYKLAEIRKSGYADRDDQ
ncbi:sla2 Src-like adaptor 2, partial [Quaeritorhiza haematococci]